MVNRHYHVSLGIHVSFLSVRYTCSNWEEKGEIQESRGFGSPSHPISPS